MHRPASPSRCNASLLAASVSCPLQAFFQYFLQWPSPHNPLSAHGTAIHEIFRKALKRHPRTGRYPYLTEEKLIGAWSHWWWGAVNPPDPASKRKSHGFGGFHESWQPIDWAHPDQPGHLYARGINHMKKFFAVFEELRQSNRVMIVERAFSFNEGGVKLSGRIDLLMVGPEGATLVDHKPYSFSEPMRLTGTQPTIYQLAYERTFRQQFEDRIPLTGLKIYDYNNGVLQDLPLRDPYEFGMLRKVIQEWSRYYDGVLTGRPLEPGMAEEFHLFNPGDIARGDITPRLPRGDHCKYCNFTTQCRQWERGELPTSRELWRQTRAEAHLRENPHQERLLFPAMPIVDQGQRDYTRLVTEKAKQLNLALE